MDNREPLMPTIGVVTDIRIDTPDVKTFRVVTPDGKKAFEHKPGQCAMLSIPGVGEAMFSITSSPTNEEYMEFSIKKCGCVTQWLHSMEVGQQITIRGPYGNRLPRGYRVRGQGYALHRRRHRPCASALRHQLLPPLPRPLRQDRHRLRLPQYAGSGGLSGDHQRVGQKTRGWKST